MKQFVFSLLSEFDFWDSISILWELRKSKTYLFVTKKDISVQLLPL